MIPPEISVGDRVVVRQPGPFWNLVGRVDSIVYGYATILPLVGVEDELLDFEKTCPACVPVHFLEALEVIEEVPTPEEISEWMVDFERIDATIEARQKEASEKAFEKLLDIPEEPAIVVIRPAEGNSVLGVIKRTLRKLFRSR